MNDAALLVLGGGQLGNLGTEGRTGAVPLANYRSCRFSNFEDAKLFSNRPEELSDDADVFR
jgi:hypothetical protein